MPHNGRPLGEHNGRTDCHLSGKRGVALATWALLPALYLIKAFYLYLRALSMNSRSADKNGNASCGVVLLLLIFFFRLVLSQWPLIKMGAWEPRTGTGVLPSEKNSWSDEASTLPSDIPLFSRFFFQKVVPKLPVCHDGRAERPIRKVFLRLKS
jgi:hypothetical protein